MLAIALLVVGLWTGFMLGLVLAGRGKLVEAVRQHTANEAFVAGLGGMSPQA